MKFIKSPVPFLAACLCFILWGTLFAAEGKFPFSAEILESGVNIRSDATVSSPVIANASKGDSVKVISSSYDWYKVTLPNSAAAYIKADLVLRLNSGTLQVEKDRVNIRSLPDESSPIIGKAVRNELLQHHGLSLGWYRIEPTAECFGWIHKKFVKKIEEPSKPLPIAGPELQAPSVMLLPPPLQISPLPPETESTPAPAAEGETITLQGIVRFYGMVFKRQAAHKLVTKENKIFLLKGDRKALNAFTYHKVKVTGKLISGPKARYPLVDVTSIEALD